MLREDYMKKLGDALSELDEETREEMLENYREHFAAGEALGRSEEELCEELGDADEAAEEILGMMGIRPSANADSNKDEGKGISRDPAEESDGPQDPARKSAAANEAEKPAGESTSVREETGQAAAAAGTSAGDIRTQPSAAGESELTQNRPGEEDSLAGATESAGELREKKESRTEGRADYSKEHNLADEAPYFMPAEGIKAIRVSAVWADVDLKCSAAECAKLRYINERGNLLTKGWVIDCSLRDGELLVEVKNKLRTIMSGFMVSGRICIELPLKRYLSAELSSISGDIRADILKTKHLSAATTSGDISIADVQADSVDAATVSGDCKLDYVLGSDISAASVSGDAGVKACEAEVLRIKSVSGDVKAYGSFARVSASAVSGDVTVENRTGCTIEGSTVSGDIQLTPAKSVEGKLHTTSGDVDLNLSGLDTGLTVDMSSMSGSMKCRSDAVKTAKTGRRSYRAMCGNGSLHMEVQTLSGDLVIR